MSSCRGTGCQPVSKQTQAGSLCHDKNSSVSRELAAHRLQQRPPTSASSSASGWRKAVGLFLLRQEHQAHRRVARLLHENTDRDPFSPCAVR